MIEIGYSTPEYAKAIDGQFMQYCSILESNNQEALYQELLRKLDPWKDHLGKIIAWLDYSNAFNYLYTYKNLVYRLEEFLLQNHSRDEVSSFLHSYISDSCSPSYSL